MANLLSGVLLVAMCLFWAVFMWRQIGKHRTELSNFFRNNVVGDWIFRAFLAFPIFGFAINIFDSNKRTVSGLIGYAVWAVIAIKLYFQ